MDLNETIIQSIMQTNNCNRLAAERIHQHSILAGSTLSDSDMKEFDDCLPTEQEWNDILSGIDNLDLE